MVSGTVQDAIIVNCSVGNLAVFQTRRSGSNRPRVPPPPLYERRRRNSVFQERCRRSNAGGAQIRELHCQAGMIYLTNISIHQGLHEDFQ